MAASLETSKHEIFGLRKRREQNQQDKKAGGDVINCAKDTKQNNYRYDSFGKHSYWLTRIVFLRCLAFVYGVAFLVAYNQNRHLLGSTGLLPIDLYLNNVREHLGNAKPVDLFLKIPTILWFVNPSSYDAWMDTMAILGLLISVVILVSGAANAICLFVLWLLYSSIINVGQTWYSFGWESQLLETGFLAIFFVPIFQWNCLPRSVPPSWMVIWGYRWLDFRIMLGAGLIKVRGDRCWKDLTCMNYHYETQPNPNPLAYYMHQSPELFHKFEVLTNHVFELAAPWLTFLPRPFRMFNGLCQLGFQALLIISGNLSFLNWLTALPALLYFDDAIYAVFFSKKRREEAMRLDNEFQSGIIKTGRIRRSVNLLMAALIAYLSIPVVENLFSTRQHMNTSFEPFRLVNTYGAFGSITKHRTEVIFEGTYSRDPNDPSAEWLEYEFKCKPGNVTRRPCIISPYHYRLDWLMWFAAFQTYQHNPWLVHLAGKFLANDFGAFELIAYNPFQGKQPPRFVRAQHYSYKYSKIGSEAAKRGQWWVRKLQGSYLPAVDNATLAPIMKRFGWSN